MRSGFGIGLRDAPALTIQNEGRPRRSEAIPVAAFRSFCRSSYEPEGREFESLKPLIESVAVKCTSGVFRSSPSNNRLSENFFDGITKPKPTQLVRLVV